MRGYISTRKPKMQQYILTKPSRLSDLILDDIDWEDTWQEKARRLQARRWRKIKHQLV